MEGRTLRPLGVGETLDVAFNLYFRNFGLMLKTTAAVVVPVMAITAAALLIGTQTADPSNPDARLYEIGAGEFRLVDESTFVIASVIAGVLGGLAYLLVTAAVFRAASDLYIGRDASSSGSLRAGLRRVHSVLWISILVFVTVFLAAIPGAAAPVLLVIFTAPLIIFLLVRWCAAIPVLMVEGAKGSKALGRSFQLVEGRSWATFGALIVAIIFIFLIEFLVSLASEGLSTLAKEQTELFVVVFSIMNGIGTLITAPFFAAVVTVIYYDLRVRKEAYDVELMTQQLESPGAEGGAVPPPPQLGDSPPPGSTPPPSTPSGW
jgi:hypothetical protein